MLDHTAADTNTRLDECAPPQPHVVGGNSLFWASKRIFDIVVGSILLIFMLSFALILLILNPFINKGSLFFVQKRMGTGCAPFYAIKFRTMMHAGNIVRGHEDPIEIERITPLGRILRKCRIDELPQVLNVLKGDMSLIGPRPDYFEHAKVFLEIVPRYSERHLIRPGISGLAQIELGYAEGCEATLNKVETDLYYIRNSGFRLETGIVLKTIVTVLLLKGT